MRNFFSRLASSAIAKATFGRSAKGQSGATTVEMGMLAAVIVVAVIGTVALTGDKIAALFDGTSNQVEFGPGGGGHGGGTTPPVDPNDRPSVTIRASAGMVSNGNSVNFIWNATNADSLSARYTLTGSCTRRNTASSGALGWSTLSGTQPLSWTPDLAGCNYSATVTATKASKAVSSSAVVSVAMLDLTPESLSFNDVIGANPSQAVFSDPETITGVDGTVTLTVTGEGGVAGPNSSSSSSSMPVAPGDAARLTVTSSDQFSTPKQVHWSAGNRSGTWTVTTRDRITAPIVLAIGDLTNLPLDQDATSSPVTVYGFDGPLTISANNGAQISVNGGAFASSGQIDDGQSFVVRMRSANTPETTLNAQVQVGTSSDTWSITTRLSDLIADVFDFGAAKTGLDANAVATSDPVTLTGFDGELPLTLNPSGNASAGTMSYSIGGGYIPLTSNTTINVSSGTTLRLQFQGAASLSTTAQLTSVTATIGGQSDTWTAGVRALDLTADTFELGTDKTNLAPSTVVTSNSVTLAGFEGPLPLTINPTLNANAGSLAYRLNGGAWQTLAGPVVPNVTTGTTLQFQFVAATSAPAAAEDITVQVSIGGQSDSWKAGSAPQVTCAAKLYAGSGNCSGLNVTLPAGVTAGTARSASSNGVCFTFSATATCQSTGLYNAGTTSCVQSTFNKFCNGN